MRYYFLAAYLPELQFDDRKVKFGLRDLLDERFYIPDEDWKEFEILMLSRDIFIIEKLLSGKSVHIEYSVFPVEFWRDEVRSPKEAPEFLVDFLKQIEGAPFGPRQMDMLNTAYLEYVQKNSKSELIKKYFSFKFDLKNLTAAIRARKKNMNVADHLVGETEVVDTLSRSNAEDFGLSDEFPWVQDLIATDSPDRYQELIEKILWEYLDELTGTDPFHFNVILSYLIKVQMLEEKLALSEEEGMVKVRRLEGR